MQKNYVIFWSSFIVYRQAFADIIGKENVLYIDSVLDLPLKGFIRVLYQLEHSRAFISRVYRKVVRIASKIIAKDLLDKTKWVKYIVRESYFDNRPNEDLIFLFGRSWQEGPFSTLPMLLKEKYPNAQFVLFLCDLVHSRPDEKTELTLDVEKAKNNFDLILSFDMKDCDKYGLIYHPLVFSEYRGEYDHTMNNYDIYFCGHAKNRLAEILECFKRCWDMGLSTDFWLIGVPPEKQEFVDKIHYIDGMSYEENLQHVMHSKCELEIMQQGALGFTQRVCEVVSFGKMLITNNAMICNAPFYNGDYILQVSSSNDIAGDFVQRILETPKDTFIDYHYKEKLSPNELLKFIDRQLQIKKDAKMKVLITGGAGFIGSNIALKLIRKRYDVVVLDSLTEQIHGTEPEISSPLYRSIKDKVEFIRGSVAVRSDLEQALKDVDYVIHLAAETGTGQSMYEVDKYVESNIGGTALLLDILANQPHHVKRVIVAESRAIYGEGKYVCPQCGIVYPISRKDDDMRTGVYECKCPTCGGGIRAIPTDEKSLIHPTSVYGITKQVQGQLVHLVCQSIGVESVSFRYQNVYGPGQSLSNPYTGILSIFSTRIKNGNGINIFEDGKETRDFVYIDDVADATILGLEVQEANRHVFNIGTGVPIDVLTVAKTLCNKYGVQVPIKVSGNYRLGDIRHNYADISLAREILGFEPKWSFEKGIELFTKWVNEQDVHEDNFDSSIAEMKAKGLYK